MKNYMKMSIINSLFIFALTCSLLSCEQYSDNEKNSLKILDRSASAEASTIKASISPVSGSTLTTSSVTFSWDHPGDYYWLDIGTSEGEVDIFSNYWGFETQSLTVDNLPSSGTIYVRLWYSDDNLYYSDYTYTMDLNGVSGSMTPASGSTLTGSAVEFNWSYTAEKYKLSLGTTVGANDLYESADLTTQSHTVQNIPQSGTVYLRLSLYKNGAWSENHDYTYTIATNEPTDEPTGEKDFIITWVNDGLDAQDGTIFANGLIDLGYNQTLSNSDVSTSELKDYFSKSIKTLYHTGHGSSGYIATSDGGLELNNISSVAVENLIVATCLTMSDKGWKDVFSSATENIMGYTNYSYDNIDDDVAEDVTDMLGNGKSYLQAWYEVNNAQSNLNDRWCCYSRSGNDIIEYSATSGNNPKSMSGSFYSLANGKVQVSSTIGNTVKSTSLQSISQYNATEDQLASISTQDFNSLGACNISVNAAKEKAQSWVSSKGTFSNAEFDKAVTLYADGTVIGYQVRFKRVINSLPVRGNDLNDYVSLLVTDNDIVTTQYHWSSISSLSQKSGANVLSATQAIEKAANAIASIYKGDKLKITNAIPCLGFKTTGAGSDILVPAYEYISADGLGIVVDAVTGRIL